MICDAASRRCTLFMARRRRCWRVMPYQTLAFDVLTHEQLSTQLSAQAQVELIRTLARASGVAGMAGGQAIDCHHVGQVMAKLKLPCRPCIA